MKSTYRLIGSCWDHLPGTKLAGHRSLIKPGTFELGTPYNIFDTDEVRRYVRVSSLFSCEQEDDFNMMAHSACNCCDLYVYIDYIPHSGAASLRFYLHRLGQIVARLQNALPETSVSVSFSIQDFS